MGRISVKSLVKLLKLAHMSKIVSFDSTPPIVVMTFILGSFLGWGLGKLNPDIG